MNCQDRDKKRPEHSSQRPGQGAEGDVLYNRAQKGLEGFLADKESEDARTGNRK